MLYVLICLSLSLAGIAGIQFLYMVYVERIDRDLKKRIYILEQRIERLVLRLQDADAEIAQQSKMLELVRDTTEEVWADVLDER